MDDRYYYKKALDELKNNNTIEELWWNCMKEADGNEKRAKFKYIKSRMQQLEDDEFAQKGDKIKPRNELDKIPSLSPRAKLLRIVIFVITLILFTYFLLFL